MNQMINRALIVNIDMFNASKLLNFKIFILDALINLCTRAF